MEMRLAFGEGVAPVLDSNSLYLKFDQEKGPHLVVLNNDKRERVMARRWGRSRFVVASRF